MNTRNLLTAGGKELNTSVPSSINHLESSSTFFQRDINLVWHQCGVWFGKDRNGSVVQEFTSPSPTISSFLMELQNREGDFWSRCLVVFH